SSGEYSRDVRTDLSSQDTMSGISIGFGSRVTTVDTRPQFGHLTVPSKTISSLPPIFPRRTRWGASAPHASHLRTRALGAAIVLSNAEAGKRICDDYRRRRHPQSLTIRPNLRRSGPAHRGHRAARTNDSIQA